MLEEGTYTATLDRIEETPGGDLAVLVVERDGDPTAQLDLPIEVLPGDGRCPGAVFEVVLDDDRFALTYRTDETERRAAAAQSRFDRLARRPPTRDADAEDAAADDREAVSDSDPETVADEETGDASGTTDEPEGTSRDGE